MSWFDRYAQDDVEAAMARLDVAIARARVVELLDEAAGPRGLRRYLVRVELRGAARPGAGAGARVTALEAEPLPQGGGPPDPARFDATAAALARACVAVRAALAPARFDRVALGFVRDGFGERAVSVRLDEDADATSLADLPVPRGAAWLPEDPAYVRALAQWDARIAPVRAGWVVAPAGEAWTLDDGRLLRPGLAPVAAAPLALLEGDTFRWLAPPLGEEAPLRAETLEVPLAVAAELVLLAAARAGHRGVFQGATDTGVLFAGLP